MSVRADPSAAVDVAGFGSEPDQKEQVAFSPLDGSVDQLLTAMGSEETVAPFSSAPISSDQRQVQLAMQTAVELSRVRVLKMVGRILLVGCCPFFLAVAIFDTQRTTPTVWLIIEGVSLLIAIVACLSSTLGLGLRRWVTTLAMAALSVGSLFHFGPLLGAGLTFVAAQLIASLLVGKKGGLLVLLLLVGSMVAAGLLYRSDFDIATANSARLGLSAHDWIRMAITTAIGLSGIWIVFERMQFEQWRTFEKEVALRVRERRHVAEREKVVRRAASLQRLESLGRLAGGIAHDFNNALVVVQCGIETLGDERAPLDERAEVLSDLVEAVERAGITARQLLSFAKRNVEEIGECCPVDVLTRLRKESARLVPAHIQLKINLEPTPNVAIAEAALEQLVFNLIQNARDALSDRPGRIEVSVATDPETLGMRLSVSDNGPGMPSDVADQAFEPFFTTKGDQGAGLGLATVWGIIRRHGGEVSLDTAPGRGTAVHLYLPAVAAQKPSSQSLSVIPPSSSLAGASRILILEDEPPVRAALRRIFVHLGFEVTEAATVDEARQACRKQSFSILLSDGVVPDGGVGSFIEEFSAQFRRAPVILCSGYLEEDLALEGIVRGKCAFLAKPFSVVELTALIRELLPEHFREATG